jgi:hypothetical protein
MRAKPSVFIEAAEYIDGTHESVDWNTNAFCCHTLSFIETDSRTVNANTPHRRAFVVLYNDGIENGLAGKFGVPTELNPSKARSHRIFALLFAAEFYRGRNLPT